MIIKKWKRIVYMNIYTLHLPSNISYMDIVKYLIR